MVKEIALAISAKTTQTSPAKRLADLEKIANNGWLISTAEVKQLIGAKPSGERFTRGSFAFIRTGKIGGQNARESYQSYTLEPRQKAIASL